MIAVEITYKVITNPEELRGAIELQEMVWGVEAVTPVPQLVAAIHHGGVVIAAFHGEKMVGFCYGFSGFHGGEVYLVSHIAVVDPMFRDVGLGGSLKAKQREWAIGYGYDKMVWTFDPLETRNAYLNLCKLGGYVKTYIPAYYGEMNDLINKGLPTDRFLLEWKLNSPRVEHALAGKLLDPVGWKKYRKLYDWKLDGVFPRPDKEYSLNEEEGCLAPVPKMIRGMKQTNFELVKTWRFHIRHQMERAFSQGYVIVGVLREEGPVNYYVLEKNTSLD